MLEKYHIRTLPLTYRVDGELPEGEFDGPAYYDAIRGGAEVKTAMVNPQDTAEGMEPVLAAGDDLLYIGISGGITVSLGLAGDVNGDGEVTNADLIRLRRYLSGQNVSAETGNADLNGDGKVDLKDLMLLQLLLTGQSNK